jgi:polyisoprenoid-binding protein YceI
VTRFHIVPDRSRVWIDARSNVHPIHSETDGLEGFVELDLDDDGQVSFDAAPTAKLSLNVSRLSSGNRLEDRELQKRIDARRYPTIDGVLETIEADGSSGRYQVAGEVTFRGVSHRYQDTMTIEASDPTTITLAGSSSFNIKDFGMEPPRVLMLRVEPEVNVRVEIVAVKEG